MIVYRVCQKWRSTVFARLNRFDDISVTVVHGEDVSGSKLINDSNPSGFETVKLKTFCASIPVSGRSAIVILYPTLFLNLMKLRPDVLLIEGGSNVVNNVSVYLYSFLKRVPIVWWTLGELPGRKHSGLGHLYKALVQFMERRARVLLGYSSLATDYFLRCGYEPQKCFKAVNCVDTDLVSEKMSAIRHSKGYLKEVFGVANKKVTLFVGALTFEKRIDRLIKAFVDVARQNVDAALLVVGDGPARASLEQEVKDLGIGDFVIFAGKVEDGVEQAFQTADIFVLPGLGGLAISEALTHSLPVICTIGDGCEIDLIQDGYNGFRIASDDDRIVLPALAEKMCLLYSDDVLRSQMALHAREVIENKYNINAYCSNVRAAILYAYTGVRDEATS